MKIFCCDQPTNKVSFAQLVEKSDFFESNMAVFPTDDNLIKVLATTPELQKEVEEHANACRPILSSKVLTLIDDFLSLKKQYGSLVEKYLYESMTRDNFIDRLLIKRPLVFVESFDDHLLHNGERGCGGFESIGTDQEKLPLLLQDYLSYDEMQISSLLSVSVPTHFINQGDRYNHGYRGIEGTFEEKGIYVGMVGTRFEKPGYMEWAHMIVTPKQNASDHGYGSQKNESHLLDIWAKFYDIDHFPTFDEVIQKNDGRYIKLINHPHTYIDKEIYKKRMRLLAEIFLVEANDRAKSKNTKAYVYAAALGLGVWLIHPQQKAWLKEAYLEVLASSEFAYISDLTFSWASYGGAGYFNDIKDLDVFTANNNNIVFHLALSNPADKLVGSNEGKLLVASYAWDGNAYPGNEYWLGHLNASGDPAAASCSTIAELQNPLINPNISSSNLFIVD